MEFIQELIELFLRLNRKGRKQPQGVPIHIEIEDEGLEEEPGKEPLDQQNERLFGKEEEEDAQELYALVEQVQAKIRQEVKKRGSQAPRDNTKAAPTLPPVEERLEQVKQHIELFKKKDRSSMICFIMYDISHNKVRKSVSEYLEEKGLVRVQKSIFMGQVKRKTYHEIEQALRAIQSSYENEDSIFFVPVAEDEIRSMKVIGQGFDANFILNRGNTLFF